jgi:biopolymer transport protein ExbD
VNFRPEPGGRRRLATVVMDITPLVDVIFQLLIFFFLTANFIQNPNIPVNLPRASADQVSTDRKDRIITIRQDGQVMFENESHDLKGLKARLARLAAEEKDVRLLIRSDQQGHVGRLVEVMEAAREAGLRKFGIATQGTPR